MTSMTRRGFLGTAGVGLAGAALAGCAGSSQTSNAGGTTTISFWQYYGTPDTPYGGPLQALFDRYMQAHPEVSIENRFIPFGEFNRTLLQSAAGGGLPDIALVHAFDVGAYAKAGILSDITRRVQSWGKADSYFHSIWDTTTWQGKNYALPHVADCYVLWYNQKILDQAGTKPPETWKELGAAARKVATKQRYGLAVSAIEGVEGATAWTTRFLAAGGKITQVDSPAGREALQQWIDLVGSGAMSRGVLGWNEEDVYNKFRNGQAAMMINSSSYVNVLRDEAPELDWKVALLPKDERRATFMSAEDLTITSGSAHPDAAWDVLTYMQRPKVLNTYLPERNKLPPRKDVATMPPWSNDPVWSVFIEQLPSAWAPGPKVAPHSAEVLTYVQGAIQSAVSGQSSVPGALAEAQRKIDGVLQG